MEDQNPDKLDKQAAEILSQRLNLIFNSALTYGGDHPSVISTLPDFLKTFDKALQRLPYITLIMDKDKFYLEDHNVDHRISGFRLKNLFKKAGLQSISFLKGLSEKELAGAIKIITGQKTFELENVDQMKKAFEKAGIDHVKLNHVIFKKITVDQTVVPKSEATGGGPAAGEPATAKPEEDALKELLWTELLEDPEEFVNKILTVDKTRGEPSEKHELDASSILAAKIKQLGRELDSVEGVNPREMLRAAAKLRGALLENIRAKKAIGAAVERERMLLKEADALAQKTVIRLICEEYSGGKITTKRLAQIIRRIVTDPAELRGLMPEIKRALIKAGMPLSEYLKLVNELGQELQNEELVTALQQGADDSGISPDDIFQEIKEDPRRAAELIALAAEIKRGLRNQDPDLLSRIMAEYIEKVSTKLAVEKAEEENVKGSKILAELISKFQKDIVADLKDRSKEERVTISVEKELAKKLPKIVEEARSSWVLNQLSSAEKVGEKDDIISFLAEAVEKETELAGLLEPIREVLKKRGIDDQGLKEIYSGIFQKLTEKRERANWFVLPEVAFNKTQMLKILDGEVARATLYPTCIFTVLMLSIISVEFMGTVPPGVNLDTPDIRNRALEIIDENIRKMDYLGVVDENKIMIIMPMTNFAAAADMKKRLLDILEKEVYITQGVRARARFAASATRFEEGLTKDAESFLKLAERELARQITEMRGE